MGELEKNEKTPKIGGCGKRKNKKNAGSQGRAEVCETRGDLEGGGGSTRIPSDHMCISEGTPICHPSFRSHLCSRTSDAKAHSKTVMGRLAQTSENLTLFLLLSLKIIYELSTLLRLSGVLLYTHAW